MSRFDYVDDRSAQGDMRDAHYERMAEGKAIPMTDRAINFSEPMVRALLAGTKTQTRRSFVPQPDRPVDHFRLTGKDRDTGASVFQACTWDDRPAAVFAVPGGFKHNLSVRYSVGDRLWVREAYYQRGHWEPQQGLTKGGRQKWAFVPADDAVVFDAPDGFRKAMHRADPATVAWHKRLGRFMPRAASRMTLLVTDVRVERLQAISERDCWAEGVENCGEPDGGRSRAGHGRELFRSLWESINGPGAWEANPWVVAVTFTVERKT